MLGTIGNAGRADGPEHFQRLRAQGGLPIAGPNVGVVVVAVASAVVAVVGICAGVCGFCVLGFRFLT